MKSKTLFIAAVVIASLFAIAMAPVEAALDAEDYNITKYDPMDDVMRVRTGGDFKFSPHNNVEIKEINSAYVEAVIPKIELTMKVEGTIKNHDDYKYAFTVIADINEYIFAAFQNGIGIGFQMGSDDLILGVTAEGENTDTLKNTFPLSEIGPPNNNYDVFGAAIYSVEDSERYLDMAPDKLILITEPSDGSTVYGTITVKGVIRQYDSNEPSGDVKIQIDDELLEDVSGLDPWSYSLDTTSLTAGEHTVYVEIDGTEYSDEIKINVDQNHQNYEPFDQAPIVHVGDWYQYETVGTPKISGINLPISSEMDTEVTDLVTEGGKELYVLKSHSEGEQDLGYVSYKNTVDRTSWKEKDGFGTVKDNTVSVVDVTFRPETTVNTTTTYSPPLENHNDFEVTVGFNDNKWSLRTTADSDSTTTVAGGDTTSDSYTESLDLTGECLYHLSSHQVHGKSFSNIFVIRTYYENPGISLVEFYSPSLGVPVQIDTYDASRQLLFSLGLQDYEQMPFSVIIEEVTFDPPEPKADEENKIIVTVKNIGTEDASNVKVTAYDGDKQVAQETISSIPAGETEEVTLKWTPKAEGSHSLSVGLSHQNQDLGEPLEVPVTVAAPEPDGPTDIYFYVILVVIIIVVILFVVLLMKRRKAPEEGEAAEAQAEEAEVPTEAGPVVVASEGGMAEEPEAVQAQEAAPQVNRETIQCPSCKEGFTVEFESKPIRVKCPNCGTEGVLS